MAVVYYNLTGNLTDAIGVTRTDIPHVKAWVESNLPAGQAIVDTLGNKIQLGAKQITLNPDGTFTISLLSTANSGDVQPDNRQWKVVAEYPNGKPGRASARERWDSGWFALTSASDIADRVVVAALTPAFSGDAAVAAVVNDSASATRAALSNTFGRLGAPSGGDDTAMITAALAAYGTVTAQMGATYLTTGITIPAGKILDLNAGTLKKFSGGAHLVTLSDRARVRSGFLNANTFGGSLVRNAATDASAELVAVTGSATATAFDANAATRPRFIECSSDGAYYGVLLNAGTVDAYVQGGYHRGGVAATSYEGGLYIPNAIRSTVIGVTVEGAAGHGAWIGGAAVKGVTFDDCTFRNNGTAGNDHRGVTIDVSCEDVTLTGCLAEGNIANGFFSTGTTKNVKLIGCTARGNNLGNRPGAHGFEILSVGYSLSDCFSIANVVGNATDPCGGFFFGGNGGTASNCHAYGNYGRGFTAFDAWSVSMRGCVSKNNSQAGVALYDGFLLGGSYAGASQDLTMIGCRSFDDQATKTQRYGASISSGVNRYIVQGNNFLDGGATGTFLDGGGATKSVSGNLV